MQLRCLGSDVSSPFGFGPKPQPTNDLVHIWAKRAALVVRFLWILLKRNNFLCKNSHSSIPSMLHHAPRGAESAYCKLGEANWQWVSWQTQVQKARMSGRGLGWEGFEAPRTSVEVRDATPKASTRIGNAVHPLQSTIGSPGSVVSCHSGSGAEPRLPTDFCAFPSSQASQNVSCRNVCCNWRPVRSLLMLFV